MARRAPASPNLKTVRAMRYIKPMRGGSAAALVGASDGKFYVVKTQRRDLPPRLLANEYIATLLAAHVGLPVAEMAGVELNLPFLRASYDAMCAHRPNPRGQRGTA